MLLFSKKIPCRDSRFPRLRRYVADAMNTNRVPHLTLISDCATSIEGEVAARVGQMYWAARDQLIRFLLLRTGNRGLAEDIAQSAYLRLLSKADALADDNLRSLLFITARNISLDVQRQSKRTRYIIDELDGQDGIADRVASTAPDAERSMIAREHIEIIRTLIAELPPKCRYAFVAYKFDERDYRDIADEMGVSESMVRKYVIRAVSHCAKRFEELEGWE